MSKFQIITFGCQMNKADSERVASVFNQLDCTPTDDSAVADYIVVNACSVRQTAIDRIWGMAKGFTKMKKLRPLKVILTGCVLEEDKKKFAKIFDLVFNIQEIKKLYDFLQQGFVETDYLNIRPEYSTPYHAYVPIMTGCNNFCSYCVVPYVRGREKSRSVKSVLLEVKDLIASGCKEIHLLGQNVNSYDPVDKEVFSTENPYQNNFAKLLWEINQLAGDFRLNFSAAHPKDMTDDVINALALPKQMNYLHLALQSGDDEILKAMNRKYTTDDYYKIIEKIRKVKPDIAIGTDIIVGFPGETEEQFQHTVDFYKKVRFDIIYHAMYSPRAGTVASKMEDNVSQTEKKRRWRILQTLMEEMTLEINQKYLGKKVQVLIDIVSNEGLPSTRAERVVLGNSAEMKRVRIFNRGYGIGQVVEVVIAEPQLWLLISH
ncbi:MAG: (Dimethylallyl)adenosine tRNA methylthiotransferase MiaB [Parcubacteria group bacterium GW2011_GWC2_39_14]|nr:MAG: (Dimethylallyl)adenosine tRNA methylthiotransferase MiaB [Parcubacteria group bacterium GW2011_GWC2_39_14]KKR54491.1 MAG: (Dimethylallyl)adenosine tRNA methylthiotransferase MiaB [Parcubacteria group bacterium GW2011_GWA2_40_23]